MDAGQRIAERAGRGPLNAIGPKQVFEAAGAAAGFAVLIYAVGAALMWLRFETTGFPADLALSVVPRARLVTLGLRSVGAWLAVVALMLLALRLMSRSATASRLLAWWSGPTGFQAPASRRALGGLATMAVGASALVTWSLFTLVVAGILTLWFAAWYGAHGADSVGPCAVVAFVAGLAAAASIGWQLQINLPYDHARFRLQGDAELRDAIYFGEAGDVVYLAPRKRGSSTFTRQILLYPRQRIEALSLLPDDQTLCTRVPRPVTVALNAATDLGELVRQHLSRTGQRRPEPKRRELKLPQGKCPPL